METIEETCRLASESGQRAEGYAADISDRQAVAGMVQKALDCFGRIDILVNNAGIHKASPFMNYSFEDFDRVMKVNVYGTFNVTQCALAPMIQQKKGKVINIASTAGKWASMNQSAYNTSKHAVVGMTRCLALEMAPFNINVNAICPGVVETDMLNQYGPVPPEVMAVITQKIALNRIIKPEEVASLAVYLASDESDGMTGQSILIDGGMVFV
jgi:NAD(P)-dependent dehydrogenase (short-subunit alcohol dehydrogenase family)